MQQLTDAPGLHGPPDDDGPTLPPINEVIGDMANAGDAAWLFDAIEYAMENGDAIYLLEQCQRHIEPARQAAAKKMLDSMQDDGEPDYE